MNCFCIKTLKGLLPFLVILLLASELPAQDRKVDPTWLRRFVPLSGKAERDLPPASCQYRAIFGEGDPDGRILRTISRFGEFQVGANGSCRAELSERQEEIYFVLEGNPVLHYGDQEYAMRRSDFTYLAPGITHFVANASQQVSRVLVMSFRIPQRIPILPAPVTPKIINLADLKEETVNGHPTSVLYKLMVGSRTATRDAIDQAYIVTSLFWMDFAPGGTNFPHHHEAAEEIYLVMDGQGEMVAGSGVDGIEGRYPSKAGDAYYFRANCTVGFYNENKPDAKAHILAVRARMPPPDDDD